MSQIQQLNYSGRSVLVRPAQSQAERKGTLILLHGYGADEYDLMGLASYFDPNLQVLSIRAPGQTPFGGAAWFDINMAADGSLIFDADQAVTSSQGVHELILEMQADGTIPEQRVVLGGFSQGASISSLVALANPELLTGLLIMSGRLTEGIEKFITDREKLHSLPVFVGHGTHDPVIPIDFGRQMVAFWKQLPVKLTHDEYPMAHEINQAELQAILNWFSEEIF